jgi:two-component system, OmpR family, sensor histidine kinase KdpD
MRLDWNQDERRRRLLHLVLTVAASLAVTAMLYPARDFLDLAVIVLVYFLPVGISAARWGMIPGIVSSFASFLFINYFFISPYGTFTVHHLQDLVVLVGFLVVSISVSRLVGRMRESLAIAEERENETARLYELSLSLSRLTRAAEIVSTLQRFTSETFLVNHVEVQVEDDAAAALPPSNAQIGEDQQPTLTFSMQGAQRLLGEIRVWRRKALSPAEERLLRAFTMQGALALERVQLASVQARGKILEESDRMKTALLSSVSHELRTPLATIKAAASSLNTGSVPLGSEASKDLLQAIEEETDRLNQLVGNLLNMSRIEAGALRLQQRWNELREIAAAAVTKARAASQSHNITMDIPEELPLVWVDDILMQQVFVNLIDNSRKYSPEGSTILIRARQRDGHLWVRVSNAGPAVSEADLEQIFEKFHRVTAAGQITGTGLGLSICKGIVEAHRGRIWAENLEQGFGIAFTLPTHVDGEAPRIPGE